MNVRPAAVDEIYMFYNIENNSFKIWLLFIKTLTLHQIFRIDDMSILLLTIKHYYYGNL